MHTHSSEHTPGAVGSQCCGARGAVGGLVPCSRVSPQSWYWRWRECWLFTPPTYNPCRTWDSNPQPSGYKSDSLSIRPRLPQFRVWWPILGICALHLTHPKCTHTAVNKHPEQWAAIYAAAPREQLGVWCLAQGHLSRGIEGGKSAVHSLPPPTIPAGPRLEPNSLTIRPRLQLSLI